MLPTSRKKYAQYALVAALVPLATIAKSPERVMRGWTSWDLSAVTGSSVYGREWLTAAHVMEQSAALASTGLQAAGFQYMNVDSYWASDPTQVVDSYGRWTPNATRFPTGVKVVADAVHARGQKFGLYLNPGVAVAAVKQRAPIENTSCTAADIAVYPLTGGNVFWDTYRINYSVPCAYAYVQSFAHLLALDWGVDFLKLDAVSPGSGNSNVSEYDSREDVAAWSAALEATGRDVWVSISWAIDATFAPDFVPHANSWRTSDDVDCYCATLVEWSSVLRVFSEARPWLAYTGVGARGVGRPDGDSLDVGQGALDGLTDDEKRSYVTLWAVICAPLYTGNDLSAFEALGLELLTNAAVLAIADSGVSATPTPSSTSPTGPQVWSASYGNGTFVVALFNLGAAPSRVTANLADFNATGAPTYAVADVWTGSLLGDVAGGGNFTTPQQLPPHGVQLIRLVAAAAV